MAQSRALIEILAEIPDFRKEKGKRHPLSAILALAVAAIMCGYRSYGAIAEWGRNYGTELVLALGFTRKQTPCAATLHTVFRNLDKEVFEAKITEWAEGMLDATPNSETEMAELEALAADGKRLRGSKKQQAVGTHLLSIFSHRLGMTLAQSAADDKSNEIPTLQQMLKGMILEGRVVTMDALNTQRETAETILDKGGDYLMIVKENQPKLLAKIEAVFEQSQTETINLAQQRDLGHGRSELRCLTASPILLGEIDWPGLEQVFKIERRVIFNSTGKITEETVYGITSLDTERANAHQLLILSRGHWSIENKSHYVRDFTFDEDRSQVRSDNIPQVMAALRNTAIGLIRWAGETNIAAACRRFAAQPWSALTLIGIF